VRPPNEKELAATAIVAIQIEEASAKMRDGPARDPYRLSAVARGAAIFEDQEDYEGALAAYRDLIRNANDQELVAVAQIRADELEDFIQ
jgi:hypothetical protein